MKHLILILSTIFASFSFAQSTLSIFNNGGQQFYVILNGIKQNSVPQTNVTVSGIQNGPYSVKLIFADGKTGDIDKNFLIDEPSLITTRVVFKKGKGKLQLIGMEPSSGSQAPAQNAVVYRPTDQTVYSDAPAPAPVVNTPNTSVNMSGNNGSVGQTVTTNQSINTNNSNTGQPGNVGINMNVNIQDPTLNNGQGGMNISVNMSGTGNQTQQSSSTIQTSETTVVTSTNMTNGAGGSQSAAVKPTQTPPSSANTNNQSVSSVKCQNILADEKKLISDLKKLNFEADRKEQLEKDMVAHCMTAAQACELISIFTFESDRLDLAKYFYVRTIDKEVALSKFMDLFTFDSNKVEFREFSRTVK
ncbi:MAG: DUF4476 domain-containing protein [Bacteroidota bacterium]|jgi:hypothetical protein